MVFEKLATFAYSNRRRVLFAAVIGAAIAGVFGAGVSNRLSPYGADDPATQSVQATNRFQAATGRQIAPGVVALVSSGDVRSFAARQRVEGVAAELRAQPDVASVASFYTNSTRRWWRATGARHMWSRISRRGRTCRYLMTRS